MFPPARLTQLVGNAERQQLMEWAAAVLCIAPAHTGARGCVLPHRQERAFVVFFQHLALQGCTQPVRVSTLATVVTMS